MRNSPLPIGYVEVQRSWVGEITADEVGAILDEVRAQTLHEQPHLRPYGSRIEITTDGSGTVHSNLYVRFEPRLTRSEPLDPRNLNDAPLPPIGGIPIEDIMPLGTKERKF